MTKFNNDKIIKLSHKAKNRSFKKRLPYMKRTINISAVHGLVLMGFKGEELRSILSWITSLYFPSFHRTPVVTEFLVYFTHIISTRGSAFAASYFKAARLALTKYIAGEPIDPAMIPGVGLDALKIPLALPAILRDRLANSPDPEVMRLSLTLLSISRAILGDQWSFDLTPIQSKPTITEEQVREFSDFVKTYMFERKETFHKFNLSKLTYENLSFHWSTKSGPNGPAIVSAY